MNSLEQHKLFLIGSDKEITKLSKKENAVILAVSDSHNRKEILNRILDRFSPEVDLIVFCGDGVNDFVEILNSIDLNPELKQKLPPVIAIVHGNCDENFSILNGAQIRIPAAISFFCAGTNILVTHGHLFGVYQGTNGLENHAAETNSKIVFYGRSHVADFSQTNGISFINPGSCALPRRGLPPSCAIIKIKNGKNEIDCTFYEIKISLQKGIYFEPFSPFIKRW